MAQGFLTHLRIVVIWDRMFEFAELGLRTALKRLHMLRVVEISTDLTAVLFVCRELGPYLLSLEELSRVPKITMRLSEIQKEHMEPNIQEELSQFKLLLRERNLETA